MPIPKLDFWSTQTCGGFNIRGGFQWLFGPGCLFLFGRVRTHPRNVERSFWEPPFSYQVMLSMLKVFAIMHIFIYKHRLLWTMTLETESLTLTSHTNALVQHPRSLLYQYQVPASGTRFPFRNILVAHQCAGTSAFRRFFTRSEARLLDAIDSGALFLARRGKFKQ